MAVWLASHVPNSDGSVGLDRLSTHKLLVDESWVLMQTFNSVDLQSPIVEIILIEFISAPAEADANDQRLLSDRGDWRSDMISPKAQPNVQAVALQNHKH